MGLRETAGAEFGSLFGQLPVEVGGDLRGGEAHAAREAALEDRAEARAHALGGVEGLGGHHRGAVGGGDNQTRVNEAREGHAVDQDAVQVLDRLFAGLRGDAIVSRRRGARHHARGSDKVIIVADHQEVIVRIGDVEAGHDGERFPLLGDRVGILSQGGVAGQSRTGGAEHVEIQAEAGELVDVEEINEIGGRSGDDAGNGGERHRIGSRGRTSDGRSVGRLVDRASEVGGTKRADQGDVLIDLGIVGETHTRGTVSGITGAVAIAVAGEDEERALRESDDFGLLSSLVRNRTVALATGHRQFDEVVLGRGGRGGVLGDIVEEEAGVGAVEVLVAGVILTGRGLEHRHQELTVRGDIDCFHALVVAATTGLVRGRDGGRVGGEAGETRRT